MSYNYPQSQIQEFLDLIAISALSIDHKKSLITKVNAGVLDENIFTEVLQLLREEDRLDKDIQHYNDDLTNFDSNSYLDQIQKVVDSAVQKHLIKDEMNRSQISS